MMIKTYLANASCASALDFSASISKRDFSRASSSINFLASSSSRSYNCLTFDVSTSYVSLYDAIIL